MAKFLKPTDGSSDPSYIGFSRETSGDRSTAIAIKGVADIFGQGIQAADQHYRQKLKEELKAGIAANGGPVAEDAPKAAAETDTDETEAEDVVDVFSEDKTSSNAEVSRGGAQAQRLTAAYRQGKLSSTAYWGRMAALSKELKARYPGYTDEIDRQFQGQTGQIPAKALAAARRKEIMAEASSANSEDKQFNRFIQTNIGHLPADYFPRQQAGNPYSKLEVYQYVQKDKAEKLQDGAVKDKLAIATSQGNLNQEEAIGAASDSVNRISSKIISNVASRELVEKITEAQASGASVSHAELEQIRAAWGLLRTQAEQAVEAELRRPTSDGSHTYYSLIKDPAKIANIRQQAMAPFDSLQGMLDNKDWGAFASTLNANKASEAATKNELLKKPIWGYINAAKELGGQEVLNRVMTSPAFVKAASDEVKAAVDLISARQISGEKAPLARQIQEVQASTKGDKIKTGVAVREVISRSITVLVDDASTRTARETAAEDMFGTDNLNFLARLKDNKQRNEVYNRLVSPTVTAAMSKVRETKPELYERYKQWAKTSFMALQRGALATAQEGIEARENIDVEWNGTRFTITKAGLGGKSGSMLGNVEDALEGATVRAVNDLNRQIGLLEGVLKVDGSDLTTELSTMFQAMGADFDAAPNPTIFQKFRKAVDLYLNPPEKEKKD